MNNAGIPNWTIKFLRTICPDHLIEEIEGDLIQKFNCDLKNFGENRAQRKLLWSVIRFFRPGIILRNKFSTDLNQGYMFANYFKVALRVMLRNKSFAVISIAGLALGITGAILLFLWIEKEFSYDQFHADKERIYEAWNRELANGEINCWSTTPRILAPTLVKEYAAVESAISYGAYRPSHLFTAGETRLLKTSGVFTDASFLTMFSFPLIKGEPSKALSNPNSIVITESFAKQLFGDKEPFGAAITIGESGQIFPFTVTGILKDLPSTTEFHFDYLISWQFLESLGEKDTYWGNNSVLTFIKLRRGEDVNHFNEIIKDIAKKHSKEESSIEVFLYPLTKLRLYSKFENGVQAGGRIEDIRMVGILGICLIAIACINFINLSTARAQKRSKEVGIRKVTGAHRHSLIMQFLCESVLIALGAGIISIVIVFLSLPSFSVLIQQSLSLNFQSVSFWSMAFAFIVFIGVLAGGYPAFYLSSFHPMRILKGAPITSTHSGRLRQLLVVLQFGFAVIMIVNVIVTAKQVRYVQTREAGYAKDHLIYQPITGDLKKNYQAYKNELLSLGVATSVTKTSAPITERWSNTSGISWNGKDPLNKTIIERINVDEDILTTAGLTLLEGRDMDIESYPSDSTAVLLNEAAVKLMGFEQPVGEIIIDNEIEWRVIGVVKDFVLTSPYQKIVPIVLLGGKRKMFGTIHIRLNSNHPVLPTMEAISTLSSKYNPAYPFEYHFVDEEYQRKFSSLKSTLTLTTVFGSIAIFIACLGLLGLSTFMIESRVKEIGIRKVMGGSVTNIIKLLSVDSLKPILVAITIFTPLAWWANMSWLQTFDYRITLNIWIFLLAGLSILTISLLTISLQIFVAASVNPVKSLRAE